MYDRPLQVRTPKQGACAPQAPSEVQAFTDPAAICGKNCRPTPMPADCGSAKNEVSAVRTASHLLGPSIVFCSIDAETSIIMYRSMGRRSPSTVTWAQPGGKVTPPVAPPAPPPPPLVPARGKKLGASAPPPSVVPPAPPFDCPLPPLPEFEQAARSTTRTRPRSRTAMGSLLGRGS